MASIQFFLKLSCRAEKLSQKAFEILILQRIFYFLNKIRCFPADVNIKIDFLAFIHPDKVLTLEERSKSIHLVLFNAISLFFYLRLDLK